MLMIKIPLKVHIDESGHTVPNLRRKDFSLSPLSTNIIYNIHSEMHKMINFMCILPQFKN